MAAHQTDDILSDLFRLFGLMRRAMRDGGVEGLGPSHHMVLMRLRENPGKDSLHQHGPSRITELAQFLHLTPAAITQIVTELEARGLVARQRSEKDRRAVVVQLTQSGRERMEAQRARRREVVEQILGNLPEEDRRELARILRDIAESHPMAE